MQRAIRLFNAERQLLKARGVMAFALGCGLLATTAGACLELDEANERLHLYTVGW